MNKNVLLAIVVFLILPVLDCAARDRNDGIVKEYYDNGTLKNVIDVNGKKTVIEEYSRKGNLVRRAIFVDDKMIGEDMYDESGRRLSNGVYKSYYADGRLKTEQHFENGKRNGTTKIYDENGMLKQTTDYKDGKAVGVRREGKQPEWKLFKYLIIVFAVCAVFFVLFAKFMVLD